ncbi:carboxylating nicotinate-nucleotide diphosphorylase [Aeoliella sp. SH292]|uniref:carboxylating nicotinate-nucleotide diphosphorylase n=1 Tax=Aeoliella sp. SH292 TaxID=3454464 RepID=UPI003F97D8F4
MSSQFQQVDWSPAIEDAARSLIRLAIVEDLGTAGDWTTQSLVPTGAPGSVAVVARKPGVVAGLMVVPLVLAEFGAKVECEFQAEDGQTIQRGQTLAVFTGSAADILSTERIVLNFLGRLSGIATLTREYVRRVAGTEAQVYDTRKTTPGWRMLEKYAVRCGGGFNHRLGLDRAVMIKDNHVALAQQEGMTLPMAVERVRHNLAEQRATVEAIEVEVDNLQQFEAVLRAKPDIVLLDNMTGAQLREAVRLRNAEMPDLVLEASGGVNLDTIAAIAATGVDRISVGALTHSAVVLDIGLDWQ